MPTEPTASEGAARERARIDAGLTGDKVGACDPAASPLGTDDEAASPPDDEGMRIAREATRKPAAKP